MKAERHCNVSQTRLLPTIKHKYPHSIVSPAIEKLIQVGLIHLQASK